MWNIYSTFCCQAKSLISRLSDFFLKALSLCPGGWGAGGTTLRWGATVQTPHLPLYATLPLLLGLVIAKPWRKSCVQAPGLPRELLLPLAHSPEFTLEVSLHLHMWPRLQGVSVQLFLTGAAPPHFKEQKPRARSCQSSQCFPLGSPSRNQIWIWRGQSALPGQYMLLK